MVLRKFLLCATLLTLAPALAQGATVRKDLTTEALLASGHASPIDNKTFGVPEEALAATAELEGRLELLGTKPAFFKAVRDNFDRQEDSRISVLPPLEIEVIQVAGWIVPTEQGVQYTGARWNYIVTPGRVWHEDGDGDWNRVAMPFALAERNQNCTHNGLLTFVFRKTAEALEVSDTAFQVTQETCLYFKFDLAGSAPTRYTPGPVANSEALARQHETWLLSRLPTKPISSLQRDYPTAQISTPVFGAGMVRQHLTTYGVVYNGVHYRGESKARYGPFPFPELEVVPSYSLAKTVFAGAALMALAHDDGQGVREVVLREHLQKVRKNQWQDVTLEHALDMATGRYRDNGEQVDEGDPYTESNFFLGESRNQKLLAALTYPQVEPPGTTWVYHTTDTFLLVNALGSYLESTGRGNDAHRWLVDELYSPLSLSFVARKTLRTGNSEDGSPLGGFGLHFLPDDLAKLSQLFNVTAGRVGGEQVLDPGMLAAAMQKNPADRGLDALHMGKPNKYNNGIWASEETYQIGDPLVSRTVWLPRMTGFGGIAVVMLPNGATYYYIGDHKQHSWSDSVRELLSLPDTTPR